MSNSIILSNHRFYSAKECFKECKIKIKKYRVGNQIPKKDQDFFKELFKLHPKYEKKVGCGIKFIKYGLDTTYGTGCLIIVRLDNTEQSISWRSCLESIELQLA